MVNYKVIAINAFINVFCIVVLLRVCWHADGGDIIISFFYGAISVLHLIVLIIIGIIKRAPPIALFGLVIGVAVSLITFQVASHYHENKPPYGVMEVKYK
jgi:hypothetical protein